MKDIEFPQPKTIKPAVKHLRDRHHRIARLLAAGFRPGKVAEICGYSIGRISVLQADPAFQELLSIYRMNVKENFEEKADPFVALATENMLKAERMIAEQLDEADEKEEPIPIRTLLAVSRDGADRLGHGKKNTTVNVNVDFAAQLEKAIARSAQADSKVLELKAVGPSSPPVSPPADRQIVSSPSSATLPFKRRA